MENTIEQDRELYKILSEEPVLNQKGRRELQRLYRYATQVDRVELIHPTVLYKVLKKIPRTLSQLRRELYKKDLYRDIMEKYKPRG